MLWLLILLVVTVGIVLSSFIENYIIDTGLKRSDPGAILGITVFSHFLIVAIILLIYGFNMFILDFRTIFWMLLSGAIQIVGYHFYTKALKTGDNIEVSVFSQIGPVFALILGYLLLNQSISIKQFIGFGLIILSALIIVFSSRNRKKQNNRLSTIKSVLACVAIGTISDVIFIKFSGIGSTPDEKLKIMKLAQILLYYELGRGLMSCFYLYRNPKWLKTVKRIFKGKKGKHFELMASLDTLVYTGSTVLYKYLLITTASIALLSAASKAFTVIITFLIGILFAKTIPSLGREKITKRTFIIYTISILVVLGGIYIAR